MPVAYPLTVYFDASCRLCNSEMQNIKAHDANNQLILIDCSSQQFDDSPFKPQVIRKVDMMTLLHAQDAKGQWWIGVDAFTVIYETVGLNMLSKLWGSRLTRPWAKRLYPWIARNRQLLSFIGLPVLFNCWQKHAVRKSLKRSQTCHQQGCSVDEQNTQF